MKCVVRFIALTALLVACTQTRETAKAPPGLTGGDGSDGTDSATGSNDSSEGTEGEDTGGSTDTTDEVTDAQETYASLTFIIDDSANRSYTEADGLAWKGSFSYDAEYDILTFDGAWGGPFVKVWDDGPLSAGGHEPEGQIAGDSVWSVQVRTPTPEEAVTFEYGAISGSFDGSDGQWVWTGDDNGLITVPGGSEQTLAAEGLTLKKWGFVDMRVSVDVAQLDPSFDVEIQLMEAKGSAWGWNEVVLADDDMDGVYHFVLSEHVGGQGTLEHFGLVSPGDQPEFVFVINDIEYKVGGKPPAAEGGVSAAIWQDGQWVDMEVVYNDKENTTIIIPELEPPSPEIFTPPDEHVALNFQVDDSAAATLGSMPGLAWKGSFAVLDAELRTIQFDATWGNGMGPYPMLHDDGPWNEGGHEPAGAMAGDGVWGVTVWLAQPAASQTFDYGLVKGSVDGGDGAWLWEGDNGQFTVNPGDTALEVPGLTIEAPGVIDMRIELDTTDPALAAWAGEVSSVSIKGSQWDWVQKNLSDNGLSADNESGDGVYTFLLSENTSSLLELGDETEFVFLINGQEYKDGLDAKREGVSVYTDAAGPGEGACAANPPAVSCQLETVILKSGGLGGQNSAIVVGPSDEP